MFSSKGSLFGVAAALVASSLLFAGMAVSTTSGAPTDLNVGAGPSGLVIPGDNGAQPGNPPAAPVEPPAANPNPTGNPAGIPTGAGAGAGTGSPSALPDAGLGGTDSNSMATLIVLLGLAGTALVGAGATFVAAKRRN